MSEWKWWKRTRATVPADGLVRVELFSVGRFRVDFSLFDKASGKRQGVSADAVTIQIDNGDEHTIQLSSDAVSAARVKAESSRGR